MLAATALLDVWERGQTLAPAERAVQILPAWDAGEDAAAMLPLDELNRRLLALRADVFGGELEFYATCAECGEGVEFTIPVASLVGSPAPEIDARLDFGDLGIVCRPPSSEDVMLAVEEPDPRRALAERCVTEVSRGSIPISANDLPEDAVEAVEAFLDERYPLLDITFGIECSECGHRWSEMLDVPSHVWSDVDNAARRLLDEVARLARAYGWAEHDVLRMSPSRRSHYLGSLR